LSLLFAEMWWRSLRSKATHLPVDTTLLHRCLWPPFNNYCQHDASEFARYLLSGLDGSLCDPGAPSVTGTVAAPIPVSNHIAGTALTQVTCGRCGATVRRTEPFWDVAVPLHDPTAAGEASDRRHLQRLIDAHCDGFRAAEVLQGAEAYRCDRCQDTVPRAERRTFVVGSQGGRLAIPPYLFVQLLRFRYDRLQLTWVKDNTPVALPDELYFPCVVLSGDHNACLTSAGVDGCTVPYKLSAVVLHRGESASAGHYLVMRRMALGGVIAWVECNDDVVRVVSTPPFEGDEPGATPYLILYERADVWREERNADWSVAEHRVSSEALAGFFETQYERCARRHVPLPDCSPAPVGGMPRPRGDDDDDEDHSSQCRSFGRRFGGNRIVR
jgi:uncharacterized UBP type Zn finger protein